MIVAFAMTSWTSDIDIREEVHFNFVDAVALTMFATTTFDIETKSARLVTAEFGFGLRGVEIANLGENASIGGGIAARGATNGRLIDDDDFVKMFNAINAFMETGDGLSVMEASLELVSEDGVNKSGFAGAGDTSDNGHDAKREMDIDVLEIVFASADDDKFLTFLGFAALGWNWDSFVAGEILASNGIFVLHDFFWGASGDKMTTITAGVRTDVNNVI